MCVQEKNKATSEHRARNLVTKSPMHYRYTKFVCFKRQPNKYGLSFNKTNICCPLSRPKMHYCSVYVLYIKSKSCTEQKKQGSAATGGIKNQKYENTVNCVLAGCNEILSN